MDFKNHVSILIKKLKSTQLMKKGRRQLFILLASLFLSMLSYHVFLSPAATDSTLSKKESAIPLEKMIFKGEHILKISAYMPIPLKIGSWIRLEGEEETSLLPKVRLLKIIIPDGNDSENSINPLLLWVAVSGRPKLTLREIQSAFIAFPWIEKKPVTLSKQLPSIIKEMEI